MRFLLPAIALLLCSEGPVASDAEQSPPDERLSGGATTVFDQSKNAFSLPAGNTSLLRRDNFFIGNAFFKQPWVIAPASTSARDGLGPLFNTNSCQGCHVKDGRGQPPLSKDQSFVSALVRLSIPADQDNPEHKAMLKTMGVIPEPVYGDQLQPRSIPGVKAEADPRLRYETIQGEFADGTTYTLLKPLIHIHEPAYGELHADLQTSVRVAPAMIGLGLLESIPEAAILALADEDDSDGNGISGRPNYVWSVDQQKTVMGRFGWKAGQPTVSEQSRAAFNGDLGITSGAFPHQPCTKAQSQCLDAPDGGQPEISDEIMQKVTFYASMLGVPARRRTNDPMVQEGKRLFSAANCIACHTPQFKTGDNEKFPELSQQWIQAYTDLLLHDMGEGLADHRPEFLANGREWRTPPLWGIGLVETVNGHTRFLHDGRARNLMEAVLWHGGEAEKAKQVVLEMSRSEREALMTFLESL